jgi:pimeloyl-ACP methyl ester carboxylesterase
MIRTALTYASAGLLALIAFFTAPVFAQSGLRALDARLSDYAYPYDVSMRRFESQGEQLEMAYMDVGPPPGKANGHAVLLLHGKNFSGAYWGSTIEALVADGYRVIVPDQIGFGKSSKPRNFQFSFQELAIQTRALLSDLGVDRSAVVGHSMGGMLATRYALMFPDHTDTLTLVNPIGLEDWKTVVPYATVDQIYRNELKKTPASVKAYMQKAYFDGKWRPAYDPLIEIQGGWTLGPDHDLTAWISALTADMIFTQPVVYEFPLISVPVLLIIGTRDRTALGRDRVSPEIATTLGDYSVLGRRAARTIRDAELVELNNIGHVPQYEAFGDYITALKDFLWRRSPD